VVARDAEEDGVLRTRRVLQGEVGHADTTARRRRVHACCPGTAGRVRRGLDDFK